MSIAALYDIHGNLPALEAVLADVANANVELILVGGDVVPGPMPVESLDLLLGLHLPVRFILGNTDREVLARMQGVETDWYRSAPTDWTRPVDLAAEQLAVRHRQAIENWPATLTADTPAGPVLFCHAIPHDDNHNFTRRTPEKDLLDHFRGVSEPVVVCGHTHMQFDRRVGEHRVINAGSVGMPFGSPGAYWLLMQNGDFELRRTDYDLRRAADRIRLVGTEQAESFVNQFLLDQPSEEQMLNLFESA